MNEERPLALITGASSGIGYALAGQFAEHGYDLLINAEDGRLEQAARRLRETGAEVRAVRADLTDAAGVDLLVSATTGLDIDVAVLNAGVGRGGAFADTDLADDLAVIELNVVSTVRLAKPLLRDMVRRGTGRLAFTSSIAATTPGPFQPVYNASKSFVQSFAEALGNEVKDTDVTVTAFLPGPTDTDFFRRADLGDTKLGTMEKDDPDDVARQAYEAIVRGRATSVTGSLKTRAQALANKVLPDGVKAAVHRSMTEPGTGGEDGPER
ncbi:SDR family NAD(P)-dependent oxidoreductase [Streptomyces sp. NEAU-sy36]|uniref:SDR family NAD(P)-dependent oxidoreductase n=1 Tax=unclassified Streptomyces TaxID=2593676 RepID=UPI0015D6297D|nr:MULTISPECIES: SDR family NAD(P)-dependent oxidoreductase [unclassified Streptomyces]QLJ02293.1 SDR family NAD(P)-dependent oxidoreductase [Streptomyces sp. NEAU-sy36]